METFSRKKHESKSGMRHVSSKCAVLLIHLCLDNDWGIDGLSDMYIIGEISKGPYLDD